MFLDTITSITRLGICRRVVNDVVMGFTRRKQTRENLYQNMNKEKYDKKC